jgi:hypothetical protein
MGRGTMVTLIVVVDQSLPVGIHVHFRAMVKSEFLSKVELLHLWLLI